MDQHSLTEGYVETEDEAIRNTELFINFVREKKFKLVSPVITPRYIPTCSLSLLRRLGQLAKKHDCHIQSHISESEDEVAFVQQLYPDQGTDTDIFDRAGLLRHKCIMAHGNHLSDA